MTEERPIVHVGDVVGAPAGHWVPAAPAVVVTGEQLAELTEAWLRNRRLSPNTRSAYRWDVQVWVAWCALADLDPLTAKFTHLNTFGRWLENSPTPAEIDDLPAVKRPAALSTVARRLSAVSSWYTYLLRLGLVDVNPAVGSDRPKVDRDHSDTAAFAVDEATAMMAAARTDPILGDGCGPALLAFLVQLGARVSEVCGAQLGDRGYEQAHHTIKLRLKGDKRRRRSMPPGLVNLLHLYLQRRAEAAGCTVEQLSGPLFVRPDGRPLDRHLVARFVRRVAKTAGVPDAARISPHSCRHAFSRISKARGATLEQRQDALGHSDPRTTRRYDQAQGRLSEDPSFLVYAALDQGSDLH